jgi:hypothetical protein
MSKAKQLLDALTTISPRQDDLDSPSLPFDSPNKPKVATLPSSLALRFADAISCVQQNNDLLFASTSPPPQLLHEEVKTPLKATKATGGNDKTRSANAPQLSPSINVQQKESAGAEAHDDENNNSSGSNSMENSTEDREEEEEESGDFEDSPGTTESDEVELEEEKKGRIRSAALEWMAEEEMGRRSAQAEKEEADRLQEKRNRRKTELLQQQQQQLTQKLPSSQDWTEKILSILVSLSSCTHESARTWG